MLHFVLVIIFSFTRLYFIKDYKYGILYATSVAFGCTAIFSKKVATSIDCGDRFTKIVNMIQLLTSCVTFGNGMMLMNPLFAFMCLRHLNGYFIALALIWWQTKLVLINATYHRLLSHKSFSCSRLTTFVLSLTACVCSCGPNWYVYHHKVHHSNCDTRLDVYSPHTNGFLYSHLWFFDPRLASFVPCLSKRELLLLDLFHFPLTLIFQHMLRAVSINFALSHALSQFLFLHSLASLSSICHLGTKSIDACKARSSLLIGWLTAGDGFHESHHKNPRCIRHGDGGLEFDLTYLFVRSLNKLGLSHNLVDKKPGTNHEPIMISKIT